MKAPRPGQLFGSPSDLAGGPRETLVKFGANLSFGWRFEADSVRFRADFGPFSGRKPWILKVPRLGQLFGGPVHLAEGVRKTQFHFEVNQSFEW